MKTQKAQPLTKTREVQCGEFYTTACSGTVKYCPDCRGAATARVKREYNKGTRQKLRKEQQQDQPKPAMRLCLGPGPDHYFMSPDPKRVHFCPNCDHTRIYGGRIDVALAYGGRIA